MNNKLLCCDWGTSSIRLRLVNTQDLHVAGEITSSEGIASTFSAWKQYGEPKGIERDLFFRELVKNHIDRLAQKVGLDLDGISLVISGMASSSIGMTELPYAPLPFPVDGRQASTKRMGALDDFPHECLLISGVRSQNDVMRGEETQLVGLLTLLTSKHELVHDTIILFPGTHSKHMYIQNQQLVGFQTFMTGEVYDLMAHHSILKDSVEHSASVKPSESELNAFKAGVHEADSGSILAKLFSVRTNQLFNKLTKQQNALYLSGLLIGSELKTLVNTSNWRLILCSSHTLHTLYTAAMHELNLSERTTTISADMLDKATIAGQIKIRQNQLISVSNEQ